MRVALQNLPDCLYLRTGVYIESSVSVNITGIVSAVAIAKPHGISWKEVFRRAFKEANENDVLGRSVQLSYYFFLVLFPMLMSIIAVMSLFGHADSMRQALLGFLAAVLPGSASDLIQKTLTEVIQGAGGLKMSFGIIFSVWSASAGMSAIMDTSNAKYEVSESRSFIPLVRSNERNATFKSLRKDMVPPVDILYPLVAPLHRVGQR
jgi:hypothetical protein